MLLLFPLGQYGIFKKPVKQMEKRKVACASWNSSGTFTFLSCVMYTSLALSSIY